MCSEWEWRMSTRRRSAVMLFWMKVVIVLRSALAKSCINSALFKAF